MEDIGLNIRNRLNKAKDINKVLKNLSKKYELITDEVDEYKLTSIKHPQGVVYVQYKDKQRILEDGFEQEIHSIQY